MTDHDHDWRLIATLPDGRRWAVPVHTVARHHAGRRAAATGRVRERVLVDETLPLFRARPWAVVDWATARMRWSEVAPHAEPLGGEGGPPPDEAAWRRAPKRVVGGGSRDG